MGNLLEYITRKEWEAVLNIIFKMKEVQNVLPWAVQSTINCDFDLYCKSLNLLKKTLSEDLKNLPNTVIVNEVMSQCPIWCRNRVILKFQMPVLCLPQLWHGAETTNYLQSRTKFLPF